MAPAGARLLTRRFPGWALLVVLSAAPVLAQPAAERLAGRRLDDALRALQAQGLRLVFSSELVTPAMRVESEPETSSPHARLLALLRPHGLTAKDGPGGILMVVRRVSAAPPPTPPPREVVRRNDSETVPAVVPPVGRHQERIVVEASPDLRSGPSPLPEHRLTSNDLERFGGPGLNDPLRAVQSLSGLSGTDDFRNDLSVRGSSPRQASLVVEGVAAPWLQHAASGRGDTGTVTMIGADVVGEAALRVGGYARLDGSQLGPQLDLTLREGSRAATVVRAEAGTTGVGATGEGPLGRRGSWLIGARQSYVEWPVGRQDHEHTVFGYADLQSKIVYDLGPRNRLTAAVVAGTSRIERDAPGPLALADGSNRAALATLAWRSVVGTRTVVRHQVSAASHDFVNRNNLRHRVNDGADVAVGYRVDVTQPVGGALLETGAQFRRVGGSRRGPRLADAWPVGGPQTPAGGFDTSWLERSGHLVLRWAAAPGLTVAPGLRFSDSTLVGRHAIDRWLEAEWAPTPRWLVHGNLAVAHQFADMEQLAWLPASPRGPERARQMEVGVGRDFADAARWRVTAFMRHERDVLWGAGAWPRLDDDGAPANGSPRVVPVSGRARGVEVLWQQRLRPGLSGSVAYSYGLARHIDRLGQAFRADFDQRHALSASATWMLPGDTSISALFRAGSPLPIPGYLQASGGALFPGGRANQAQLPAYARLDLRAERAFAAMGRKVSLVAAVVNVLDRTNRGLASGSLVPGTLEVTGATERLYPRLATFGVRVRF